MVLPFCIYRAVLPIEMTAAVQAPVRKLILCLPTPAFASLNRIYNHTFKNQIPSRNCLDFLCGSATFGSGYRLPQLLHDPDPDPADTYIGWQ